MNNNTLSNIESHLDVIAAELIRMNRLKEFELECLYNGFSEKARETCDDIMEGK